MTTNLTTKHLLFYTVKLYFDHLLTMNLTTNLTTKKTDISAVFFAKNIGFQIFLM